MLKTFERGVFASQGRGQSAQLGRSMKSTAAATHRGQPSWTLKNDVVDARVTVAGGMIAPVAFSLASGVVSPLAVAPWAEENVDPELPQLLKGLRGDFFCAPFGGNGTAFRGERHPPHGESANADWTLDEIAQAGDAVTLHAHLVTGVRRGRVKKRLTLRAGHTAIYCEHVLEGMRGPMTLGTHPCLQLPDREGGAAIAVGGWKRGQVLPVPFENPAGGGYASLKMGARFTSLKKVPLATGGTTDLSRSPARRGFEDLVMLLGEGKGSFGWSAVTFLDERYVFLQIKNPRVLRHTVLWLSNGGRHYAPWSGRHVNVLGLEEVTANFHLGLAESARPNAVSKAGYPTTVTLDPKRPLRMAHILAVVAVPRGFDAVKAVRARGDGVEVVSHAGKTAWASLDLNFVQGE